MPPPAEAPAPPADPAAPWRKHLAHLRRLLDAAPTPEAAAAIRGLIAHAETRTDHPENRDATDKS